MFEYNGASVEIKLINSSSNNYIKHSYFEFTLYSDEECKDKLSSVLSDNRTGIFSFNIRNNDVMYLKQTKAGKGYSLSSKIVKLEYKNDTLYVDDKIYKSNQENIFDIFFFNDSNNDTVKINEVLLNLVLIVIIILEIVLLVILNERRLNNEKN